MRESEIQSQIKKHLEFKGWMVIKIIQSTMNGIPDLMALRKGKTVFIEVKQPGKKPNDLQAYRHQKLREQGFDVLVATRTDDVFFLG